MTACDYCGRPAELVNGDFLYPHRPDLWEKRFWRCTPCGAWVGCHPRTNKPLGRLANAELRQAKQEAHAAFAPIWKARYLRKRRTDNSYTPGMARGGRYKALAEALGIPNNDCHIGMFDVGMCRRVVELCKAGKIEA